jgi:hypothetical protein
MDPYTFSLTLGSVGLGVMALSGFAQATHAGHGHGAHSHAPGNHAGHGLAHGTHSHTGDSHATPAIGAVRHAGARSSSASRILALLQPRVAFSVLVGLGATGMLLRPFLSGPWLLAAALGGGLLFEWGLVAPLWRFLFRFASAPAQTLESVVSDEARAVTGFDANGNGLVAVELDGQVVQLLATLTAAERATAGKVRAGDRLRIEAVDDTRNRCTVTYLGA